MKLSIIILTKEEERMIQGCIESVTGVADEIIVIDADSQDNTAKIAKSFGAKVFLDTFTDFATQRNLGLSKASGDWVLYIDADERIDAVLERSIRRLLENGEENQKGAYCIKRKNYYLGNNEWPYIEKLERLFKKNALRQWEGKLHESPRINGTLGEIDGFLLHYTHRDLSSMLTKTIIWSKTEAELRLNTEHPQMTWWRFPRVMLGAFLNSYVKQGGWRVGTAGLIESTYQAFSMFVTYARLWEMQQSRQKNKS